MIQKQMALEGRRMGARKRFAARRDEEELYATPRAALRRAAAERAWMELMLDMEIEIMGLESAARAIAGNVRGRFTTAAI